METTKTLLAAASAIALTLTATSCNIDEGDDGYQYLVANALVTIKPSGGGSSFVMQLDEDTALKATNITASPYGEKEVRALANLSNVDKEACVAHVNWLDSIRTKAAVMSMGDEDADEFGNDPVEIVDSWETTAEDGYLTLRFRTLWGDRNVKHDVNLVHGVNPEDPYEVVFRHDANGDLNGKTGDGYVAFRLSELPDTEGKYVTLTLKWLSFSGEKTAKFQYCTRK